MQHRRAHCTDVCTEELQHAVERTTEGSDTDKEAAPWYGLRDPDFPHLYLGGSVRACEGWAGTAARRDQARALLSSRRIPKRMILGIKGRRLLYAKPAYEGGTSREMRIHIMCDTGIRHARGLHGCRVQRPQQGVFFNRPSLSIRHDHQPSVIPLATREKIAVSAGIFAGARSALPAALA